MNFLDMKTVIFSHIVTDLVCTLVIIFLWYRNRQRFAGLSFWVAGYFFQTVAVILVVLRGSIPDVLSMVVSNTLAVSGAWVMLMGLERFVDRKGPQLHNGALIALFVVVHIYFIFFQPNLSARSLNTSLGILVMTFQCLWLLLRRVDIGLRPITRGLGLVFGVYSLVSVIRVFFLLTGPGQGSDFFKSGALDTLILLAYQMLFIIQTYSLILMVNRRLIRDVASQEERFHTMADFTYDWDYWIGPDNNIVYMTPSCDQVTGYRVEEFIRDPELLTKVVHPDDVALVRDHISESSRSEFEDSIDFRIVTRSGELRWINHVCRPVYSANGRWLGRRISNRDITARKRAEEALKKSEEELQEKNEALTNLLYAVSHDLKSPLVTIKSFTGYLKQDISRQDQMTQMKDIGFIQNAAEQMGVLLDELLDQSRISGKDRHKEEILLETVVNAALNLVAGQISKRQALVELTAGPVILYGDPQRLIRLYQNLIDNAVKFMGDQPAPQVEIGVIEPEGRLVLYVRDNGSGIDPQHHKRIFDLFEKGNAQAEGTGIGLALVKRIMELHNGQIWCESEGPGKGTTFYFTLEGTRWG